jgi:putative PIN family toxin of toxin-antitoxin system
MSSEDSSRQHHPCPSQRTQGLARQLLTSLIESKPVLLLSNEMLHELARVLLRYPRLQEFYGLSEDLAYDYVAFLRRSAETVTLNPLLTAPVRDVNDVIGVQTAMISEADVVCTNDEEFIEESIAQYSRNYGIGALDDIALMARLRT